ncbi:uncharacterized protein LY89DRAFT_675218 [Mollisia scopiformis]|uniref:Uncharacterized protein n=1 Tax=Mollisia scopiformis TaxID=149040 RepID=A0A132BEU1_MOLSC|nr:uncharacterized protein LY89DRAFT_675218 [Mollisia scopiformis]KUJ10374.1 hypothetical protein LY89DRAFT_675218 [Mollisia scopiformis]
MFPKWRWEAVSGMTASGQELIRVERAVYYNSRGTESCQTSSTLSLLRGLMDLPFELRSPVYDHIASMPRTIDIFESDKISGGISTTDTLRQLSNAHPRFEEDIKVWLKTRPALRKLRSGEIFDATSVSFLLDFDEYFLKAICTSDTEMLKNINWTKFRNTLSHPTFNENAQRLVIDISKFHKSIDNSILGAVFPILSRYLGKLRNLQNIQGFGKAR